MNTNLFICRLSIAFPGLDADNPRRKKALRYIYNQLETCANFWLAQMYHDFEVEQPDYPEGLTNGYRRTEKIYLYRILDHTASIPHIAKLCEGYAGILAMVFDADIRVDYPESLPSHCPMPCNPDGDDCVPPRPLE